MRHRIDRDALDTVPHGDRAGVARKDRVCCTVDNGDGVTVDIARIDTVQPHVDGQPGIDGDADRDRGTDGLIGRGVDDRDSLVDGVGYVETMRRGIDGQRTGISADGDGRDNGIGRAIDDRDCVAGEVADVDALCLCHDKEGGCAHRYSRSGRGAATTVTLGTRCQRGYGTRRYGRSLFQRERRHDEGEQ